MILQAAAGASPWAVGQGARGAGLDHAVQLQQLGLRWVAVALQGFSQLLPLCQELVP